MLLKVISTGSQAGNCYALIADNINKKEEMKDNWIAKNIRKEFENIEEAIY